MTHRKVKLIERSDISLKERSEAILVYSNQKPATTIIVQNMDHYDKSTNTYKLPEKKLESILKTLRRTGIPFEKGDVEMFDPVMAQSSNGTWQPMYYVERAIISIAQTRDLAERLMYTEDEEEIGKLYGYPKTAIDAYLGQTEELEKWFTQFIFSADYFKDELKSTSMRWENALKKVSPDTYKEVLATIEENKNIPCIIGRPVSQEDL